LLGKRNLGPHKEQHRQVTPQETDNKLLYAQRVKFQRYKGLKLANGAAFG